MKKSFLCIMLLILSIFCLTGCKDSDKISKEEKEEIYYVALDNYGYEGSFDEWQQLIKEASKLNKKTVYLKVLHTSTGDKIQWSFGGDDAWKEIYSIDDITGFHRETFTITFEYNAPVKEGEEVKIPEQKVLEGDTAKEPKDVTRENYSLKGWKNTANNKKWNFNDAVYEDLVLEAIWTKNQKKVSLELNGGVGKAEDVFVDFDKKLEESQLPTVTKEGYTFAGWRNVSTKEVVTFPLELVENINLEAVWEIQIENYVVEEIKSGTDVKYKIVRSLETATDIFFPDTINEKEVIAIGKNVLGDNKDNVKSVVLGENIKTVESEAFLGCTKLESVDFKNATVFGNNIFTDVLNKDKLNIKSITIKNAAKLVELFGNAEERIPSTLKTIKVVYDKTCTSLIKDMLLFNLPNTELNIELVGAWTELRENEFSDTKINSIVIPESVTTIATKVFAGCNGLNKIVIDANNKVYDSREDSNAIIKTEENILIAGCKNTKIPASVLTIGDNAFFDCKDLTTITIPDHVTTIGNNVFVNCVNLKSIVIPNSVTEIGNNVFYYCINLESIKLPESLKTISNELFKNCESLKEITLPNTIEKIGYYSFYKCESLENLELPENLKTIEYGAFKECSSLKEITIHENLKEMGFSAFRACSKLTKITVKVVKPELTVVDNYYYLDGVKTNVVKEENSEDTLTISSNETWMVDNTDTEVKVKPDWNVNWNHDKVKVEWVFIEK